MEPSCRSVGHRLRQPWSEDAGWIVDSMRQPERVLFDSSDSRPSVECHQQVQKLLDSEAACLRIVEAMFLDPMHSRMVVVQPSLADRSGSVYGFVRSVGWLWAQGNLVVRAPTESRALRVVGERSRSHRLVLA